MNVHRDAASLRVSGGIGEPFGHGPIDHCRGYRWQVGGQVCAERDLGAIHRPPVGVYEPLERDRQVDLLQGARCQARDDATEVGAAGGQFGGKFV